MNEWSISVFGMGIIVGFIIDWLLDVRYQRKLNKAIKRVLKGA